MSIYRYLYTSNLGNEVVLNKPELVFEATKEAKIDLTTSVEGEFSQEDLKAILEKAHALLEQRLDATEVCTLQQVRIEWQEVVRSFYEESYWGFRPLSKQEAKKIKSVATSNHRLGIRFIWITFFSMCISKVIILVLGQRYVKTGESSDFWFLMLAIFLIVANFAYFLWSARNYKD